MFMGPPVAASSGAQSLPESCTSYWVSLVGFVGFIAAAFILRHYHDLSTTTLMLLPLAAIALPMIVLELGPRRVHTRQSSGLDFSARGAVDWVRIGAKLFGFVVTFVVIAILYWLLPVYHGEFYAPFWQLLEVVFPVFLLVSIPYFIIIDRHMSEPRDGYWHCGMAVLGFTEQVDKQVLVQYVLGWLVKAFFIPLMFMMYLRSFQYFLGVDFAEMIASPVNIYTFFFEFSFLVDLVFACVGYVLTMRLLDTHIRSSEPTVKGWAVALMCYEPFWTVTYGSYLAYDSDSFAWGHWLMEYPVLYSLWGATIIALLMVYAASTMTFGLRFSNLTHRGILTNGPYRVCKHPAYVTKNLTWWLIAVPFIVEGGVLDAVRDCLLLLGVNVIYYLRARTEERHLSWDPVYREYATLMNDKSIFRGVAKWLPFLRYQP
jgi:hypothetical protein